VNRNVKKGFVYEVVTTHAGFASTFSSTDREVHAQKRRVLAPGFTDGSIRAMDEYMLNHIRVFLDKVTPQDGATKVMDMGLWSNYLTFDVMADVAFGKDFGMLEKEELRFIPNLVNAAGHRSLVVHVLNPRCSFARFAHSDLA
jgi:cytochrome P450